MIIIPNSIITQVFKARYFKIIDIMEAYVGSNPSYVWFSIFRSKDLLKMGVLWKVGDEESINTRRDTWVPKLANGKISSRVSYKSNVQVKLSSFPRDHGTSPNLIRFSSSNGLKPSKGFWLPLTSRKMLVIRNLRKKSYTVKDRANGVACLILLLAPRLLILPRVTISPLLETNCGISIYPQS